ncbi:ParB/RepB/Spo0J family partition protein [Altericroceibacterium endophyticum]|uniref:ParB/RepB/Spo0J family partition protein n=1 Tax=Altericroceibacterium endophyticum TaxID=1808508 RepID=A0A6I4T5D2_9SPHN|nr:ParB/RepB/Spo0J family partition protein [Altericroceibacterium endophyticum]MXO65659.1 ParB/RepB/Spo0J family partition protein [Altericroceibacterium endophyticum]
MSKNTDTPSTAANPKPANKRKLGRGLGALLGEARQEEPLNTGAASGGDNSATASGKPAPMPTSGVANLSVAIIEPHPDQPRRRFDEEALEELAASIASRGVIQPVIVRPLAGGRYQIVAGERRWRAAQKARLHEIPALIRELEEREVMALALIENIQREDLSPVEEGQAYQRLADQEHMTQAEIAQLVEKSRSHVANMQRLLSLPDDILDHVDRGKLSMGHARALIGNDNASSIAKQAIDKNLSVRDVEKLVRREQKGREQGARRVAREPRDTAGNADILAVQQHLEEYLGLSVKITPDSEPNSGAVTIRYRTLDQLDLVCQRLSGGEI